MNAECGMASAERIECGLASADCGIKKDKKNSAIRKVRKPRGGTDNE